MTKASDKIASKLRMKDVLGQKFIAHVNKYTNKLEQVIVPANFRVGITPCDAALTVTGPIFSLCSTSASVISGTLSALMGFSGSLTRLSNGNSYLVQGANVTITSSSNGSITIAATGGGGGDGTCLWTDEGTLGVSQTGSVTVGGNIGAIGFMSASLGLSGSLTRLVNGLSYLVQGANVTITSASNGSVTISATDTGESNLWTDEGTFGVSQTGSVTTAGDIGAAGFVSATLGLSGSLTRLTDGNSYLVQGLGVLITSESNGSVTIAGNPAAVFHSYMSDPLYWTSTTWKDITTVATTLIDTIYVGIVRTDNMLTFDKPGYYHIAALFNTLGADNYIAFRVTSSSRSTLLQHTNYTNMFGQHRASLIGNFHVTGAGDWVALEYAQFSGSVAEWASPAPIDGEAMRTVNISVHSIGYTVESGGGPPR